MQFVGAGPLVSLYATTILLIAIVVAYHFGRWILGCFSLSLLTRKEKILFSIGLGLLAESLGIFFIGIAGFLTHLSVLILFGAFVVLPSLARLDNNATGDAGGESSIFTKKNYLGKIESRRRQDPWRDALCKKYIFLIIAASVFFLSFIQALAPCTGMDALAYHLYLPKEFLRLGRMAFLPLARESLWPFNTEMLFMAGLLFQGTVLAQLFHWIFYLLTAMAVYFCTRRYYGAMVAAWAAIFFMFTPAVFAQSGYPYVDLSLAFFVFMAVYAFLLALESGGTGAYALAGVFCGGAIGTKFLGLGGLMLLFPMALWASRFNIKKTALFVVTTLITGGGWYLRSWTLSGNPVYPLFPELFGGHGWSIQMDEGVGMGKGLLAFLLFPWNVTVHPNAFGGEMIGALFLTLLPVLFLEWRGSRPVSRQLAFFSLGFMTFLFSQSQHVRFFIAATPFLSIGAGVAFARAISRERFLRAVALAVTTILLFLHLGIFIYRVRDIWPVVSGRISARDWLMQNERSFQGFDYLQRNAKASDKILNAAEVRYFYAPEHLNIIHWPQVRVPLREEGVLTASYLEKERFDIIWVVEPVEAALENYITKSGYKRVFSYEFAEKPDIFRNTIYRRID